MYLFNPLEQFEIFTIYSYSKILPANLIIFHYTNLIENLFCSAFFVIFFSYIVIYFCTIVPRTNLQFGMEKLYTFIENLVLSNALLENQRFFPFIFILTLVLFTFNLTGMIPYNFTASSHIIITFFMSFSLFFGINFIGVRRHKEKFLGLFLPEGVPFFLKPLLVLIELVSYFSRVLSLAIRIFANMMAGHTLLKILSTFLFKSLKLGSIFLAIDILPIFILCIIITMETGIAFLQVYVFMVLTSIYIKDVFYIGH